MNKSKKFLGMCMAAMACALMLIAAPQSTQAGETEPDKGYKLTMFNDGWECKAPCPQGSVCC